MKKGILVLLVFAAVAGSAFADFDILSYPPPVQGGNFLIDAGIGFRALPGQLAGLGAAGLFKVSIPPLFLQGEYALPVGVPISVGAGLAIAQWKGDLIFWDVKITATTPHVRADWHWGFDIPWLDLFSGISMGGDFYKVKLDAKGNDDWGIGGLVAAAAEPTVNNKFFFAFQLGAHFYFSEHVGAVVETGFPFWLKAGISFKFGGGEGSGSSTQASRSSRSSREYMLVNVDSLNVRKGPSADTELVGALKRNDRVQVLEKPGQWWKIKLGSIEGYVNSSYLKAAAEG